MEDGFISVKSELPVQYMQGLCHSFTAQLWTIQDEVSTDLIGALNKVQT